MHLGVRTKPATSKSAGMLRAVAGAGAGIAVSYDSPQARCARRRRLHIAGRAPAMAVAARRHATHDEADHDHDAITEPISSSRPAPRRSRSGTPRGQAEARGETASGPIHERLGCACGAAAPWAISLRRRSVGAGAGVGAVICRCMPADLARRGAWLRISGASVRPRVNTTASSERVFIEVSVKLG